MSILDRLADGRTDLVYELVPDKPATTKDRNGTSLIQWCAYYGDVSAVRYLISHGEHPANIGDNMDLGGAAFHGHWQLCQFLLERGADPNWADPQTGESILHTSIVKSDFLRVDRVVEVLLAAGASPNCKTIPGIETGAFMRDCRTKGETPLHRAAAFASEKTIRRLLDAGAKPAALDMNGDSPLSWASWYLRPDSVLRLLLYDDFYINPKRDPDGMSSHLLGKPHHK